MATLTTLPPELLLHITDGLDGKSGILLSATWTVYHGFLRPTTYHKRLADFVMPSCTRPIHGLCRMGHGQGCHSRGDEALRRRGSGGGDANNSLRRGSPLDDGEVPFVRRVLARDRPLNDALTWEATLLRAASISGAGRRPRGLTL
ncbi:hypothetical protein CMUS01_14015 [Colletotrichum musicola]|uniref:F-box domain-containing protein n=1 Tax=Colletotrichum musicola TaxID=2175873 RepID=A0A8H6J8C7_9PEZI|nr:hypothetical protein CMUS01_14015 [Colletotrichum musicola]